LGCHSKLHKTIYNNSRATTFSIPTGRLHGSLFSVGIALFDTINYIYARSKADATKGSPYSITKRRVPELIPVLGSQPASDVSHKPGGRLPLFSTRPAVTFATLKRAATNFAAW